MEYFEVSYANSDKVEQLLSANGIYFEKVDKDRVMDWDECTIEDASDKELVEELIDRSCLYDVICDEYVPIGKEYKKEIIRKVLGHNNLADLSMMQEDLEKLFNT